MKYRLFFVTFFIFQISAGLGDNNEEEEKMYVDYSYNNRFSLKKYRTIKVIHLGNEGKIFKIPGYMYENMIIMYYVDLIEILNMYGYGFKLKMHGKSVVREKIPSFNYHTYTQEDINMFCFDPKDEKTDKFIVLENQFKKLRTTYSILNPNQPNWPPLTYAHVEPLKSKDYRQ